MRKVTVELKVKLTMTIDDGAEVGMVIGNMIPEFCCLEGQATIEDTEITDFEVTDSR